MRDPRRGPGVDLGLSFILSAGTRLIPFSLLPRWFVWSCDSASQTAEMFACRKHLHLSALSVYTETLTRRSPGGRLSHVEAPHINSLSCLSFRHSSYHTTPFSASSMSAGVVELTVPATGKKITVQTGLFINNKFVPSVDSQEKIECVQRTCPVDLISSSVQYEPTSPAVV